MAFPTILFNTSTGSDTAASGAGPATALTGSSASTDGTGLIVTLDGSPDLSGVAVDGSHVIYLNDTTANARNFGKITAKDNTAKTVTVANAFGLSLSGKSWAIGSKRLTIFGTNSRKLMENNSGNGDAMPGWILQMESGFTDTSSAQVIFRRAGNVTDGPITLRGDPAADTQPILTFSNNGTCFNTNINYIRLENFELLNTNATKTASVAISTAAASSCTVFKKIKIRHATNKFWKAIVTLGPGCNIDNCHIANTANFGIDVSGGSSFGARIQNCLIDSCGSSGINSTNGTQFSGLIIQDTIVKSCASHGILIAHTNTNSNAGIGYIIDNCTIDQNNGDGIRSSSSKTQVNGHQDSSIINCSITGNTGYGINFSNGTPPTLQTLQAGNFRVFNCNFGTGLSKNSLGNITAGLSTILIDCLAVDPQYVNTTTPNYAVGQNLKALGYPSVIGFSGTTSYQDIGVAQRQEAGLILNSGFKGMD